MTESMIQAQNIEKAAGEGKTEWLTGQDGSKHFLRVFPAENPRALVLYLHGIEGHSLWFSETASFLKGRGLTVAAPDRRGSGMNKAQSRQKFTGKDLLNDLETGINYLLAKADGRPVFLMANCWGAKLAALHCRDSKKAARLSGLILSSPAIEVKVDLPFTKKLEILLDFLSGGHKEFALPLAVEDFTDTPYYLDYISRDPLRLTQASSHFLVTSFILTLMSKQEPHKLKLPVLVLQSGKDNIVNENGIKKWFMRLGSQDKSMKVFESVKHSLDFHSSPEEYRNLLADWILQHSPEQGLK